MSPDDLKRWRARNDYSKRQAGIVLCVTRQTVIMWEQGRNKVPVAIALMCECVDILTSAAFPTIEALRALPEHAALLTRLSRARATKRKVAA